MSCVIDGISFSYDIPDSVEPSEVPEKDVKAESVALDALQRHQSELVVALASLAGEDGVPVRGWLGRFVETLKPRLQWLFLSFDPTKNRELYREQLNEFSGGQERSNACHVVAHYVSDYMLHTFRYPPHLNGDQPHWAALLFRNRNGEYSRSGKIVKHLGETNEQLLFDSVEASLLKGMSRLSMRIASIGTDSDSINYDHDFVLNVTMKLLNNAMDHFSKVNEAVRQYGIDVDSDVLRAEFGATLHRGLSGDPRLNVAERRHFGLYSFFQDVADRLLSIANPQGASDLEVPYILRGSLWRLLGETIIPNALYDIAEEIFDPYTLDSLLLTILDKFDAEPSTENASPSVYQIKPDSKQKRLNDVCGKLVKELLTLFVPSLTKTVFLVPGMHEKMGNALGVAIREQVSSRWTVDEILNSAVEVGLPVFHPGEWKKMDGKKVFLPWKETTTPLGDKESQPAKEFKFTFSKNELERREWQEIVETRREELEQSLLKRLDRTLNMKIKRAIPNAIDRALGSLKSRVDPWVEGFFGRRGLAIKKLLGEFVYFICRVVVILLKVVLYPLTRFVGILTDRYTKTKAKDIVKRMQMDIHRNLIFTWIDTLVDSLRLEPHKTRYSKV